MDEDRTTTAEHPLDAHRDKLVLRARVAALSPAYRDQSEKAAARDALGALLEDEQGICARDAIRIAHAWLTKKKTPTDYRMK